MYSHAYSKSDGMLVSLWSGPDNTDQDFEGLLAAWRRLDIDGAGRVGGVLHLIEVDGNNPRPDAHWRKRISEFEGGLKSRPMRVAIISVSPLIRGVLTAIQWCTRHVVCERSMFATFDAAVSWAEKQSGQKLPSLGRLRSEARSNAAAGGRSAHAGVA